MSAGRPLLSPEQFDRYRRHLTLPELGVEGQTRLLESSVLDEAEAGLAAALKDWFERHPTKRCGGAVCYQQLG